MSNFTRTSGRPKISRETLLLIIVAAVGLGGLAVLQFMKNDKGGSSNRTLVQSQSREGAVDPQAANQYQRVQGNLIKPSENPEQNKPFFFRMENFMKGATYELDLGDGQRKAFAEGIIKHVYRRSGPHTLTLYATYEGQVIALQNLTVVVAPQKEDIEIAPIIESD